MTMDCCPPPTFSLPQNTITLQFQSISNSNSKCPLLQDAFWWVYLQYFKTDLTDQPLVINDEVDARFTRWVAPICALLMALFLFFFPRY